MSVHAAAVGRTVSGVTEAMDSSSEAYGDAVADAMYDEVARPAADGGWDCTAYGAKGTAVGALCFFSEDLGGRVCGTATECADRMAGERVRLFDRIGELAAAGDPAGKVLAQEFSSPDELLGGADPAADR